MFNKAILVGRLTADPELKQTPSGIFVCAFRVAADRRFSKDKQADFIPVVAWRERAEFVSKYFHKGDPIGVEGSIQTRQYEDKTGAKRTAVEVVADNVFFVGGKSQGNGGHTLPLDVPYSNGQEFEEIGNNDDLPF